MGCAGKGLIFPTQNMASGPIHCVHGITHWRKLVAGQGLYSFSDSGGMEALRSHPPTWFHPNQETRVKEVRPLG